MVSSAIITEKRLKQLGLLFYKANKVKCKRKVLYKVLSFYFEIVRLDPFEDETNKLFFPQQWGYA